MEGKKKKDLSWSLAVSFGVIELPQDLQVPPMAAEWGSGLICIIKLQTSSDLRPSLVTHSHPFHPSHSLVSIRRQADVCIVFPVTQTHSFYSLWHMKDTMDVLLSRIQWEYGINFFCFDSKGSVEIQGQHGAVSFQGGGNCRGTLAIIWTVSERDFTSQSPASGMAAPFCYQDPY